MCGNINACEMLLRGAGLSAVCAASIVFFVTTGFISVVLGQQQVVVNPDFKMGLYGWEAVIVSPPATIEATGCGIFDISSEDGACVVFYTPASSEGYIRQVIHIPTGSTHIEIRHRSRQMLLRLYVQFVELDENRVTDFLIEPSRETATWRKQISHLAGKNVEIRFGVRGEGCQGDYCRTYVDYIRILVYPTTTLTTDALTSAQTQTVVRTNTYIITIPVTETVRENRIVTQTIYSTEYLTTRTTETNTVVLTTTIALTNTMVQLPFFTVGIDALYYFSTVGAFILAVGVFLFSYDALRPSKERITRRMAFGLAIIYAFFAGIFIWPLIPLFLRGDPLNLIFTQYVNNLIVLVLLLIFAIPTFVIYARMLSRHNKSSQS
jgi:hypothetical protein